MDESFLESAWDNLLSRNPALIRLAYAALDEESQKNVLAHLQKMSTEPGWHPEQVQSAQAALQALEE
jgi:hypothetical protein